MIELRRPTGFTLIELLVVIAIIAILAAILFPVFARAREKARQASCQSNLKQTALGYLMYAQDYDEWFPGFINGRSPGPRPEWFRVIEPYVKNTQIYICPSSGLRIAPNRYSTSNHSSSTGDYWGYRMALIQRPADKFLIMDAAGASSSGAFGSRACTVYGPYDPEQPPGHTLRCRGHIWPIHNEMANIAFCDGHVKTMKPDDNVYGNTTAGRNLYWIGTAQ